MFRPINLVILAVLVAGSLLVAREAMRRGGPGDNVAAVSEQVVIGRTYRVDQAFVARTGQVPGVAFQIILPKRPEQSHSIGVEELPEGGVVQFNFRAEDESFLESLFMAPIRIPLGEMDDRLAAIAPKLAEQGPALLSQKFEEVTAEPVREVRVGHGEGYRAMELTGTYLDPRDEARYSYRFIALPDPERAESLYAVSHVNRAHLAVEAADFGPSLTGKALSTLRLSEPPVRETAQEGPAAPDAD
ncbi:hypothetical protein [Vannielia litorea]|uniref:Uncharacterized protein n=1 Tax=Vannielia litorea TaxID=1217970 RepID=A0A1N6GYU3_9RHOB|nr:hypothetical protein [Vannielia litorea]SIO12714.1 hypothetical protein SAMN05444002_2919 [Vannielia litorea]